jgi:CRP/FNR family cyclic AMP-dependent transcriptional regulator
MLEEAGAIRRSDGIIHCHVGRLYGIAEPDDA